MSENEYHDYDDGSACEVEKCPRCGEPYEFCECEDFDWKVRRNEMEQCLVTKEDIRSLFNEFIRAGIMDSFGDEIISKFFKSKKPVEVIAEEKVSLGKILKKKNNNTK